ncbi:MAG TPA: hypothetical protein VGQ91_18915, partial [Ideonella sp.]|nr:hypothetical protein [Ideonella sp.]
LAASGAEPRPAAAVVSLAAHRAAREESANAPPRAETVGWGWQHWGGLAAAVAFGVLVGRFSGPGAPGVASSPTAAPAGFTLQAGRVLARGEVQAALAGQSAAQPAAGQTVAVQLSFVDTQGAYCRTFSTAAQAGLACREGTDWAVHMLIDAAPAPSGEVRQAASALPPALLAEVDRRIVGAPFDAKAEKQALERGWEK